MRQVAYSGFRSRWPVAPAMIFPSAVYIERLPVSGGTLCRIYADPPLVMEFSDNVSDCELCPPPLVGSGCN